MSVEWQSEEPGLSMPEPGAVAPPVLEEYMVKAGAVFINGTWHEVVTLMFLDEKGTGYTVMLRASEAEEFGDVVKTVASRAALDLLAADADGTLEEYEEGGAS